MDVMEKVLSHYVAYTFSQGKDAVSSRKFPPLMSAEGIRSTDFHVVNKVYLCNLCPAVLRGSHRWPVFPRSGWPVGDWELVCHLWFCEYRDRRLWLLQGGTWLCVDVNHTETQRVTRVLLYVTDLCHWCVSFAAARQIHNHKKFKTWATYGWACSEY